MDFLEKRGDFYDILVVLQPTSPLRMAGDIDAAIELLFKKRAGAIISICEMEHPPQWANRLPSDGCMKGFIRRQDRNKVRQELDIFYRINGALYLGFSDYIRQQMGFIGDKTFGYIMPKERSIDIDTEIDFKLAEVLKKETDKQIL